MSSAISGCVTLLDLQLPPGVRTVADLQFFSFHWKSLDGVIFNDYSLLALDGRGRKRFDRPMSGPELEIDNLPDLSKDSKLWEEFRFRWMPKNPRHSLLEAYAIAAFYEMLGKSSMRLSLSPRDRMGLIDLRAAGSNEGFVWKSAWHITEVLSCFTFDSDIIDWNTEKHEIEQPQAQAA